MNSRPMTDQALMSGFMTDTSYANTLLDTVKGRSRPMQLLQSSILGRLGSELPGVHTYCKA